MEPERARFLTSLRGREALEELPPEFAGLPVHTIADRLRRVFAPGEAGALGEQVELRARALAKLGETRLLLTGPGLEMMTHPLIAERRARRIAAQGLTTFDLTCGLGGDLLPVVAAGVRAAGLERDAATALLAAANVPGAAIVRGDARAAPFRLDGGFLVLDPSRREGGSRRFDPAAFSPSWDACMRLLDEARAGVLKAPPGIDHAHIPESFEAEFVQVGRVLREAALWVGGDAEPGLRRAVLLPSADEITSREPEAPAETVEAGTFLFDPHSCVTRAGLVRQLAHRLGARLLDPHVAYLTADEPATSALSPCFELLEAMPFSVSRLKARLRQRGWRPDEIRRRAFPIEPDDLRRLLGPLSGDPVTLVCTTLAGRRTVFITRAWSPAGE